MSTFNSVSGLHLEIISF